MINEGVRAEMGKILDEIRSGEFATEFIDEVRSGGSRFAELRKAGVESVEFSMELLLFSMVWLG